MSELIFRGCWRASVFLFTCMCCGTAAAESSVNSSSPAPTEYEHSVAADISMVSYAWSGRPYSATALGASYHFSWDEFEAAAGARGLLNGNLVGTLFELFLSAALTPALGFWHPSLGVELGYSSLTAADRQTAATTLAGLEEDTRPRLGRAYVCLAAAPLRARFGPLKVSALELDVGSTLPDLGRGFRVALVLARLEWRLP